MCLNDLELKFWMLITRNLPNIRGFGRILTMIRKIYNRKKRNLVIATVHGCKMELAPSEYVDSSLLFSPQFYEPNEISFIKQVLKPGKCFIDIGANIGIYSLIASKQIGKNGKVFAIEADPFTYKKLLTNIKLNSIYDNVEAINIGVSNKSENLKIKINISGNRGSSGFLDGESIGPEVNCVPLSKIIDKYKIKHIDGMKLDIEGMEYCVLEKFFNDTERESYPQFVIIEYNKDYEKWAGGNPIDLLKSQGYKTHSQTGQNYIMILKEVYEKN